jgi:WD40 repeat protein
MVCLSISGLRGVRTFLHIYPYQTLAGHTAPISALDFSEPYGTLVSASTDDNDAPRVWDLLSGETIGTLRGHAGAVKCVQVEDHMCLTGGTDGVVRLWDLRRVGLDEGWSELSDVPEESESDSGLFRDIGDSNRAGSSIRGGERRSEEDSSACVRALEGHSRAITSMFFEGDCLVSTAHISKLCFLSTALNNLFLSGTTGHRCIRQDTPPVGSHHRAVCDDHGHSLGHVPPATRCWRRYGCTQRALLLQRGRLCCSLPSGGRWQLGHV